MSIRCTQIKIGAKKTLISIIIPMALTKKTSDGGDKYQSVNKLNKTQGKPEKVKHKNKTNQSAIHF